MVLAGLPAPGPPSKRSSRADRVARSHNLSAGAPIVNVAAVVRKGQRADELAGGCFADRAGDATERGDQLLRFVQSRTCWRRRSISERAEGLGRIGGPVLTVAVMESGGLPDERRVDGV